MLYLKRYHIYKLYIIRSEVNWATSHCSFVTTIIENIVIIQCCKKFFSHDCVILYTKVSCLYMHVIFQ